MRNCIQNTAIAVDRPRRADAPKGISGRKDVGLGISKASGSDSLVKRPVRLVADPSLLWLRVVLPHCLSTAEGHGHIVEWALIGS